MPFNIKEIRYYYAFNLFFSLILWYPVFYQIMQDSGLDAQTIFKLQSLYYLSHLLVEAPSGYLADRFGSIFAMRLGALVMVFANIIISISMGKLSYTLHFITMAFARAMITGSDDAYLYRHLRFANMVEKFKYVEGRARSLALSAKIITWFSVGYLVSINQKLPYLLTALSGLIAFLISLKMKEPKILNNLEVEQNFFNQKDYLKNIKNVFIKPIFLILIINGFLLSIVSHIVQINFFQPILIDKNIDISKSGMIMALMTFFEMLGSILLKPINQVLNFYAQNDRLRLIIYSYLFSIGLIIVAFGNYSLMLFGFCLFGFGLGCAHPTHSQLINDVITVKNVRASVLSIQSIFHRLIISMVVANLSFITKNHLTEKFLVLLSIFCMILTPILIYFISKQKSNLSEQNFEN